MRHARARLWLAEGDFERALRRGRARPGALREQQGRPNPTWTPWRSTAALALAHLGPPRRGRRAGRRRAGAGRALRRAGADRRARCTRAPSPSPTTTARVALCERALAVIARRARAVLEAVRAAARARQRAGLHGPARRGARRAAPGAGRRRRRRAPSLLAQRARRELVATGLRPRQAAIEGAAALTPRQRQVCELAAAGKGNRAIAQELFLSVKTVETHLAAGYRKLGVNARADLAAQLAC